MSDARRGFAAKVAKGDRLESLVALRDVLAAAVECCTDAAELSSLALRLQRVLADIADLGGANDEESDDLAARRDAKLRAATGS